MFYGSCRRVYRVLSLALEPMSKSTIHYLARIVSSRIIVASKRGGGNQRYQERFKKSIKHMDF